MARASRCYSFNPADAPRYSAGTAGVQLPALFRHVERLWGWERGSWNLDLGGGPSGRATAWLARRGVRNVVCDPGHQGAAELAGVRAWMVRRAFLTVTCANVLNVLPTWRERAAVLEDAARAVHPEGVAFFSVYRGTGCGRGCVTARGWQEHRPTASYVGELRTYFARVEQRGSLLVAC
jgi:hypothetical protein